MKINETVASIDHALITFFSRHGHRLHRLSLGVLFIWFGLLKPLGHETGSTLLGHTVFWGDPETVVPLLGWWEVGIGIGLLFRPLLRVALALLVLRLPGILLAFVLKADVCFVHFPLAPTPEGQYLIKDLTIFFATIAIAGLVREQSTPDRYH